MSSTLSQTDANSPVVTTGLEARLVAMCKQARVAAHALNRLNAEDIDCALGAMADALESRRETILAANEEDLAEAEKNGTSGAMLQRLCLEGKPFEQMVAGLRHVIGLPSPIGEVLREWDRPNGLRMTKRRVPIGVIGIIYESRPNVTVDAASLCLKAGNAVILRGGSEAWRSNAALAEALSEGARAAGLPQTCIQLCPTTDREAVSILCKQETTIDVIIPRGGHGLIERVTREALMPVIKHYNGICHAYVHAEADPALAIDLVLNAKIQKPGVCNAIETLLVDRAIADTFIPCVVDALQRRNVEVRGDAHTQEFASGDIVPAKESDWTEEYLDLVLSVRVVKDLTEAVEHINLNGSHHSDLIVTTDNAAAEEFLNDVDSASVFWNASTRFADGFEFGFGAEIGISTDKLHARGPMGLEELTSYKYLITGTGQIRE